MKNLYACIMAGGTGTRFWPVSRVKKPKQLLSIVSEKPLINMTMERISGVLPSDRMVIVTGDAIYDEVIKTAKDVPVENVISEPSRRNTAPCILLAAKWIYNHDPDSVMCVLPSDHLIDKKDLFLEILKSAYKFASEKDALVILGICANYPETGYGYVEFTEKAGAFDGHDCFKVKAFHEKPNLQVARKFVDSGNFFWNSGMFVWRTESILKAIERHLPRIYEQFERLDNVTDSEKFKKITDEIYPEIQGISIDYGVMERADNIYGFSADIGWNDVGSWRSLAQLLEPDESGNVHQGKFVSMEAKGCIASADDGIIVAIGVKDLIIVHSKKATLVCDKNNAQQIKEVFGALDQRGLKDYL